MLVLIINGRRWGDTWVWYWGGRHEEHGGVCNPSVRKGSQHSVIVVASERKDDLKTDEALAEGHPWGDYQVSAHEANIYGSGNFFYTLSLFAPLWLWYDAFLKGIYSYFYDGRRLAATYRITIGPVTHEQDAPSTAQLSATSSHGFEGVGMGPSVLGVYISEAMQPQHHLANIIN